MNSKRNRQNKAPAEKRDAKTGEAATGHQGSDGPGVRENGEHAGAADSSCSGNRKGQPGEDGMAKYLPIAGSVPPVPPETFALGHQRAIETISREYGHGRAQVCAPYLGSPCKQRRADRGLGA